MTASGSTAVLRCAQQMLVAVSACMLAATFRNAGTMLAVFGSAYILAAASAEGGCSAMNSSSLATGHSAIKWGSPAKGGCSASNSSSLAAGETYFRQVFEHVSWETTVTAVMVTVLLLSLSTSEVWEVISSSLEKIKQNEQQFEHGQGADERQERMTAAVRMIMTSTIRVSGRF